MSLDQIMEDYAVQLNVPSDALKCGIVLLGSYVFALLFLVLPKSIPALRHIYSILVSVTMFVLLFEFSGILELAFTSLIVYILAMSAKTKHWMPVVCFVVAMGHLSWCLLRTQVFSSGTARFDVTAPMMVLVIKLTSFAWSVYDAGRPVTELVEDQNANAVRKFPSILEFFGYVFFFPSFLVGPALLFRDYQAFIGGEAPFDKIPSRILPVLTCLLYAFASLAFFVVYSDAWSYQYTTTESFRQLPLYQRFLVLIVCGFISRTKFYTAWKLAEGACCLVGIGYAGKKNGKDAWDRASNVNIFGFELGDNPKSMLECWNQKTGNWLRSCIYLRLTKPGKKPHPMVTVITYLVSAFWHGFHAGYYFTFLSGAFLNLAGRGMRRTFRPLFIAPSKLTPYKRIYDFLGWVLSYTAFNFVVGPFQVLTFEGSIAMWSGVYFIPLIGMIFFGFLVDASGLGGVVRRFGRKVGASYGGKGASEVKMGENGHANGVKANGAAKATSSSSGSKKDN
ncbi:lysophospholipid acyltransferase [Phlyctochytrium planicorne]|nr:lysophospholipid acyltransferase [Phlyctochytrium planicorne]